MFLLCLHLFFSCSSLLALLSAMRGPQKRSPPASATWALARPLNWLTWSGDWMEQMPVSGWDTTGEKIWEKKRGWARRKTATLWDFDTVLVCRLFCEQRSKLRHKRYQEPREGSREDEERARRRRRRNSHKTEPPSFNRAQTRQIVCRKNGKKRWNIKENWTRGRGRRREMEMNVGQGESWARCRRRHLLLFTRSLPWLRRRRRAVQIQNSVFTHYWHSL